MRMEIALTPAAAVSQRSPARATMISGAMATAIVILLYLLLFWNHFVGLRSGSGEYSGGIMILRHYLPYRDYFAATPPLNALKAALELSIFGHAYIVSRACE